MLGRVPIRPRQRLHMHMLEAEMPGRRCRRLLSLQWGRYPALVFKMYNSHSPHGAGGRDRGRNTKDASPTQTCDTHTRDDVKGR